jgi:hypothetical protein
MRSESGTGWEEARKSRFNSSGQRGGALADPADHTLNVFGSNDDGPSYFGPHGEPAAGVFC